MLLGLNFELINACNLRCKMCSFKQNQTGIQIPIKSYKNILHEISIDNDIESIRLDGNGESLLYSDLPEAITEAKKYSDKTSLITNGTLLNSSISKKIIQAGLDLIQISMTGIDPEIYSEYQGYGISKQKCLEQIKQLTNNICKFIDINNKNGRQAEVVLKYIMTDRNSHHFVDYMNYWKIRGVDKILITPLYGEQDNNKLGKKPMYKRCQAFLKTATIYANGDLAVCCVRRDDEIIIGNVFVESITEIMKSNTLSKMIDRHDSNIYDEMPLCCKNCYEMVDYYE